MRILTLLPTLLLGGLTLASASPEAATQLETRTATGLFLDGVSDVLLSDGASILVKRQNTTSTSSNPPPIGDALDEILNGGFFDKLLDLLRDSDNIFTPEWNDKFSELVDSVSPLAYTIGQFLGQLLSLILNGGFGGGGSGGETPSLPTESPSPTSTSGPGFEWPDFNFTLPTGSGDDLPTATATETPAPTSSSDSGFDFGFDFPSSSGDDTADLGAAGETSTGSGDFGLNIPTGTTPDESQFTGGATAIGGKVGYAASGVLGVLVLFAVLG
ncbi:hypothetical protein BJY01DRAFT_230076 [Aspergillus pseudoustus]|uniref:Uncharacterized protein n=1 Tax=Aspergillus pseudoustus TaxID=1810923 RepID=A0ABR4ID92_9EURO